MEGLRGKACGRSTWPDSTSKMICEQKRNTRIQRMEGFTRRTSGFTRASLKKLNKSEITTKVHLCESRLTKILNEQEMKVR